MPRIKEFKYTKETRDRIAQKMKGNKNGLNTRFKKGNKFGGRPKGFKHSEETKRKFRKHGLSNTKEYKSFWNKKTKAMRRAVIGSHTLAEWQTLKAQYNWTCPCCHKSEPEIKLTEDHIIPISKGGSNNVENIQPLCMKCNLKKSVKIIKYQIS